MAFLPDDPERQKYALGIILLVAGAALYWFYVHQPRADELVEMEDRVAELEYHNRQAEARTDNLDAVREELEESERVLGALQELVPSGAEIPEIYESIANETRALDLDLVNVVPSQPTPAETEYYLRQNWEMVIEGTYHDVGAFLTRVASFRRIVRPEVDEIRLSDGETAAGGDRGSLLRVSFGLETFVLPPSGGSDGDEEAESAE
ncbi:MAG: type 4a pilus biogenesis protein PilO [Gemmatimonadota bacterium]